MNPNFRVECGFNLFLTVYASIFGQALFPRQPLAGRIMFTGAKTAQPTDPESQAETQKKPKQVHKA